MKLILGDSLEKRIDTEFGSAWLDLTGHYYISVKRNGKWTSKPLQKAVYEKHVGEIPAGMDVHHLDHNPANNDPSNLKAVTKSDHRRIHAGWVQTDGVWTHKPCRTCKEIKPLTNFCRQKARYQAECKPCDNKRRIVRAKQKRNSK